MKLTEIIQPVTLTETVGCTDLDITSIQNGAIFREHDYICCGSNIATIHNALASL